MRASPARPLFAIGSYVADAPRHIRSGSLDTAISEVTNPQLTILSMSGAAVANALYPTIGTASPSANVDSIGVYTGLPAFSAFEKLAQRSDSTP